MEGREYILKQYDLSHVRIGQIYSLPKVKKHIPCNWISNSSLSHVKTLLKEIR